MITRPFAGGEQKFAIGFDEAVEWERLRHKSLYRTALEIDEGRWLVADLAEAIRLALIGGGMKPDAAAEAVEFNVRKRPLAENYKLLSEILTDTFFGPDEPDGDGEGKSEEAQAPN